MPPINRIEDSFTFVKSHDYRRGLGRTIIKTASPTQIGEVTRNSVRLYLK